MSESFTLPPGIITQLQKGTTDDRVNRTADEFWKQFEQFNTDKDDRSDNVRLLEDSETDGVSFQLKKSGSKTSDWLQANPLFRMFAANVLQIRNPGQILLARAQRHEHRLPHSRPDIEYIKATGDIARS